MKSVFVTSALLATTLAFKNNDPWQNEQFQIHGQHDDTAQMWNQNQPAKQSWGHQGGDQWQTGRQGHQSWDNQQRGEDPWQTGGQGHQSWDNQQRGEDPWSSTDAVSNHRASPRHNDQNVWDSIDDGNFNTFGTGNGGDFDDDSSPDDFQGRQQATIGGGFNNQMDDAFTFPESTRALPRKTKIDEPEEIEAFLTQMGTRVEEAHDQNEAALSHKSGWKKMLGSIANGFTSVTRAISLAVENDVVRHGVTLVLELVASGGDDYTKQVAGRVAKELHDPQNKRLARFVRHAIDKENPLERHRRLKSQGVVGKLRSLLRKPATIAGNVLGDLLSKNNLLEKGQNIMIKNVKGLDLKILRPNCRAFLVSFLTYKK